MTDNILIQDYLRECFRYFPDTGKLLWRLRPRRHFKTDNGFNCFNDSMPGKEAGYIRKGYRIIKIDGEKYSAHRLILIMVYGFYPDQVDHLNGDGTDNRLNNLRYATCTVNAKNKRLSSKNVSGISGVSWNKRDCAWSARIGVNNVKYNLGWFKDFFEACCARKSAENKYGFHPNHGRLS